MAVNLKKIKLIRKKYRKEHSNRYDPFIDIEDEDATFNVGGKLECWRGSKISDMVRDHEGRRVLKYVISNFDNIDEDIMEMIQYKLDEVYL